MAEYMSTTTKESVIGAEVSYHAVFTGVIVALALALFLNILGNAIGIAAVDPFTGATRTLSSGPVLWSLGIPLVSFIIGGFCAAAVSKSVSSGRGALLGLLVWGLGLIFLGALWAVTAPAPVAGAMAVGVSTGFWLLFFAMCLALIGGVFGGYLGSRPLHRSLEREREAYVQRHATT